MIEVKNGGDFMQWIRKTIPVVFVFLCFFFSLVFLFTLSRGDTFVNYGFSYAIRMGEIPYLDFNMVITPLAPFLYSIGLFLFNNIIMFYLEQACLLTILFFLLKKKLQYKVYLFFFLLLLPYPIAMVSTIFPGYNFLLVFLFFLFYLGLEKNQNPLLLGFLLGLIFCTKQTIGIVLFIPSFWYIVKQPKTFFKMLLGYCIPIATMLLLFAFLGNFSSFIDLCFLGLFDFQKSNQQVDWFYFLLFLIGILYLLFRIIKNPKDISLYYVLLFSSVVFPIIDYYHVCLFFILPLYLFLDSISFSKKGYWVLTPVFLLICFLWGIVSFQYLDHPTISNYSHFSWVINRESYQKQTKDFLEYVDSLPSNVHYFMRGSENYFFQIIHSNRLSYFDLPNYGNYGYNGIDKMLTRINQQHDCYFVLDYTLLEKQDVNQQYIVELGEYVVEHSKKVKRIGVYDIYYKE